jgi:transcription initiation factor IIE alpha subunit
MKLYGTARGQVIQALNFSATSKAGEMTAYAIAKSTGYTARHINRVLALMWHEGTVGYVDSVGKNGKPCRRWTTITRAKKRKQDGWIVSPYAAQQMELNL